VSVAIDEVIHAPNRLAIRALLSSAGAMEFGAIREELAVADSVASKHPKPEPIQAASAPATGRH
jgi:hypothetical protein